VAIVAMEIRLVNDMKSIMSKEEFRSMIGHLAAVLEVIPCAKPAWMCRRSFALEELPLEPPLPDR